MAQIGFKNPFGGTQGITERHADGGGDTEARLI